MNFLLAFSLMQMTSLSGSVPPEARVAEEWAQFIAGSAFSHDELLEDPHVRAEVKRVGLEAGCQSAMDVVFETRANGRDELLPFARDAAYAVVPAEVLRTTEVGRILGGQSVSYLQPVGQRFRQLAREPLAKIAAAASSLMLQKAHRLAERVSDEADAQAVPETMRWLPDADSSQAYEKPSLLSLICMARLNLRPPVVRFDIPARVQSTQQGK